MVSLLSVTNDTVWLTLECTVYSLGVIMLELVHKFVTKTGKWSKHLIHNSLGAIRKPSVSY
jgi:hypothetical protein